MGRRMRRMGWLAVGWIAIGCQRLEVEGPGESLGDRGSSSSSSSSTESDGGSSESEAETTAVDASSGGEAGSDIPGCDGNPPADPQFQEDGSHSNCNGEACSCDEVCVRPHLVCVCGEQSCDYHERSVSCQPIPPQCVGLLGDDAVDCMLPVLCEEGDVTIDSTYHGGELTCSEPVGDCY